MKKRKMTSLEQCQEKGQTPGKKLEVKVSRELEQHEDAALKTAMRKLAERIEIANFVCVLDFIVFL